MLIACYCRVSTEEQARHGLSIDTQLDNLRTWAKENGHTILREYVDAGVSGKKPYTKRPALSRFIEDLESGLKVDALVFCKLDRFFRSVKHYYQIVGIMEKHGVGWQAIHEDYETMTSAGRFRTNIMLSIAEAEADRTSERIKVVFDRKIAKGECCNPNGLPPGLVMQNKKLVPDENADAVRAAFVYYNEHLSVHQTMTYLREQYGMDINYRSVRFMLKNRLYIGEYKDNTEFCQPIIDRDLFNSVQKKLEQRSIRHNPSGRVYIFSGLLRCCECNSKMTATPGATGYTNYRCPKARINNLCSHRSYISEKKIERYLLEHVGLELDELIKKTSADFTKAETPKKKKPVNVEAKLARLKDLYVDGLIDKQQYLTDRDKILQSAQQTVTATPPPDYAAIRQSLGEGFQTRYNALKPQAKRSFWHSLLDHIEINQDRNIQFFFKT